MPVSIHGEYHRIAILKSEFCGIPGPVACSDKLSGHDLQGVAAIQVGRPEFVRLIINRDLDEKDMLFRLER